MTSELSDSLRLIVDEMDEGAAVVSREGIILFANGQFARMLGIDPAAVVGTLIADVVIAESRSGLHQLLAAERNERCRAEITLRSPEGRRPVRFVTTGTEAGSVLCFVHDIVERESERTTARELSRLLDRLPVAIYLVNPDGTSRYANAEAHRLAGLPDVVENLDDALAQLRLYETGTTKRYPVERIPVTRALAGETAHAIDIEIHDDPDQVVPLEMWGTPVFDDEGKVEYAIATAADITARVRAERVIANQAAMLDLAHDAVIVWHPTGRVMTWNAGAQATYGYSSAQALGAQVHDLLQTTWPRPLDTILHELFANGRWEGELEQRRADGSRVVVDSRWAPHLDIDGSLIGIMEVNRDATARVDAERTLVQRAAELERANREISRSNRDLEQFAYAASHDLAEPLRAIQLPLAMLARRYQGQLGKDADEYIDFAIDGCGRMQTMIDDLLQWSRVGRIEDDLRPVDCALLLTHVLEDLGQVIAETGAIVDVGPLPTVRGERSQLAQVFQNLIANAIKFVATGDVPHVEVAATRTGEAWRFTVTDNGIGIDPRQRERVFGMFKRLHPRNSYPGSGIGLALVKRAVERHGGEIGVEDAPSGKGSRFWFTLPESPPER